MAKHQCPYCGSKNTEEVPSTNLEDLISAMAAGIAFAGITIPFAEISKNELRKNKHVFHCNNCSHDFIDDKC